MMCWALDLLEFGRLSCVLIIACASFLFLLQQIGMVLCFQMALVCTLFIMQRLIAFFYS